VMKVKTQGWGDSMVSTKYVYQRLNDIMNQPVDDTDYHLSRFLDELALNFKADTGKKIGEKAPIKFVNLK